MKLTGFIKEHNEFKEAKAFEELLGEASSLDYDVQKVIHYLRSGKLLLAWMGYFFDIKTKKPIAPDSYYTDGLWVWPAYFPYYLENYPLYSIDPDFLAHMIDKNFELTIDNNFEANRDRMEEELYNKF